VAAMSDLNPIATKCFHDMEASLAAWSLGRILSLDLPKFAAAALAAGTDSPSLRWLAGWSPTDATSPNELLMRVVDELGLEMPDSKSTARRYAVCVSRLILSAEIRPADRAKEIWRTTRAANEPTLHDLDSF